MLPQASEGACKNENSPNFCIFSSSEILVLKFSAMLLGGIFFPFWKIQKVRVNYIHEPLSNLSMKDFLILESHNQSRISVCSSESKQICNKGREKIQVCTCERDMLCK